MEIMAIGNLNLGQDMPTVEAEMNGMFGSTLQSALENVAQVKFSKDLGKEETKLGNALIASLISVNLMSGITPEQDVPNWINELLGSGEIPEEIMSIGEADLDNMVEEIMSMLQGQQQEEAVSEEELFETVFKVVKEVQEFVVHEQTVVKQMEQDAPYKIAGEMRVVQMDEKTEEITDTVVTVDSKEAESNEDGVATTFVPAGTATKIEQDVRLVFSEVQTDNVVSTVLDRIETALNNGNKQLFIRLQPEVLGGLAMKLSMSDKGLVAKIVTTSQETQNILNTQITDLENTLKDKGIQVASVEISYNSMNDDTRKHEGSGDGRSQKQHHRVMELSNIDYEDTNSLMEIYEAMMAVGEEAAAYQA